MAGCGWWGRGSWRHKMTARGMLIRQRWKNLKHFIFSVCLSLSLNSNFSPLSHSSIPLSPTCRVVFRSSFSSFSVLVTPPVVAMVPLVYSVTSEPTEARHWKHNTSRQCPRAHRTPYFFPNSHFTIQVSLIMGWIAWKQYIVCLASVLSGLDLKINEPYWGRFIPDEVIV